jgi:uncharacterized protein (TIGR02246 family)
MRTTMIFSGVVLLAGAICFGVGDEQKEKPVVDVSNRSSDQTSAAEPVSAERSADEEAIRQADDVFVKAYEQGDAKSIAALFTIDAEYVDESGNVFQGREAIEQSFAEFFAENPSCNLEMNIYTIRFISPGVAVEDGSSTVTRSESRASIDSRYTTVYVKSEGKWLAASVRDHAPKYRREHRVQLQQLDWLLGDWVDEGDDAIVNFSCESVDNGNFLLRKFTILIAGQEAMSGTQRIGWDPTTGKLRAWIFDSEGGYCDGLWHRDSESESWILKTIGVTADGQTASSTSIYTFVNEHTMTWQTVDHEIAGVRQADSEVYTIVRQAPAPLPATASEEDK